MTHLHLDHASGMAEFPQATFVALRGRVGGRDDGIAARCCGATAPSQYDYAFDYRTVDYRPRGRVVLDLRPHLRPLRRRQRPPRLHARAHAPGTSRVICRLADRDLVIAGDAVYTLGQLEGTPGAARTGRPAHLPPLAAGAAPVRAASTRRRVIIPSHDPDAWAMLDERYARRSGSRLELALDLGRALVVEGGAAPRALGSAARARTPAVVRPRPRLACVLASLWRASAWASSRPDPGLAARPRRPVAWRVASASPAMAGGVCRERARAHGRAPRRAAQGGGDENDKDEAATTNDGDGQSGSFRHGLSPKRPRRVPGAGSEGRTRRHGPSRRAPCTSRARGRRPSRPPRAAVPGSGSATTSKVIGSPYCTVTFGKRSWRHLRTPSEPWIAVGPPGPPTRARAGRRRRGPLRAHPCASARPRST